MIKIKSIAILGGGNIGRALATGWLQTGIYPSGSISVTRRNIALLEDLKELGARVTNSNKEAVKDADLVILAVQPRQAKEVLEEIRDIMDMKKQFLVSVVAGLSIEEIQQIMGNSFKIQRAMPNTAAAIGESMTCLAGTNRSDVELSLLKEVFDQIGQSIIIREKLMSAATILGACGIAYFLRYIRAASQGGIQVGFHAEEAQAIAAQTARGAATLLLQSGNHPEREIDKVTTPRGCTIAGLNEMEHHGLSSAIIKGIITSFDEIEKLR